MRCINFAAMNKQSTFDYKILASYLLPKGILEFFDVTAVNENHTGIIEYTGDNVSFFTSILTKKMHEKRSGKTLSPMVFPASRNQESVRGSLLIPQLRSFGVCSGFLMDTCPLVTRR